MTQVITVLGHNIGLDSDNYLSAANLRAASGRTDSSSEFNQWYRSAYAKDLGLQICRANNIESPMKQLGGRAGTWLHPELAWGYCEYLSAKLHRAVVSTFNHAVSGD